MTKFAQQQVVNKLVLLANQLDNIGLVKEANEIDIIREAFLGKVKDWAVDKAKKLFSKIKDAIPNALKAAKQMISDINKGGEEYIKRIASHLPKDFKPQALKLAKMLHEIARKAKEAKKED